MSTINFCYTCKSARPRLDKHCFFCGDALVLSCSRCTKCGEPDTSVVFVDHFCRKCGSKMETIKADAS